MKNDLMKNLKPWKLALILWSIALALAITIAIALPPRAAAQQLVNIGAATNDNSGDTLRTAFAKANTNALQFTTNAARADAANAYFTNSVTAATNALTYLTNAVTYFTNSATAATNALTYLTNSVTAATNNFAGLTNAVTGLTNRVVTLEAGTFTAAVSATTLFSLPTNYVPANWTPTAGKVLVVASNTCLYAITQAKTNLITGP